MVGFCITTRLAVFEGGPAGKSAVETPEVVLGMEPVWLLVTR